MIYHDIPVIIPILAAGYVLTIYLVLILAERSTKMTRLGSVAHSRSRITN